MDHKSRKQAALEAINHWVFVYQVPEHVMHHIETIRTALSSTLEDELAGALEHYASDEDNKCYFARTPALKGKSVAHTALQKYKQSREK